MRNDDFPTKGDKLFISIDKEGKWLPSGIKDIFKLSEGYRLSAVSLYQEIKKNEWFNRQYLSSAMVFSFRQFLEVRLKELIYLGKRGLFEDPKFKITHNLEDLFQTYVSEILPQVAPTYDTEMVSVVNKLLQEFNFIDPKSMSFRYPVDHDLNPIHNLQNFDIDNFKEVMDKLANFFDCQLEILQMLEDYNAEMTAEMASEYASYMYDYCY